MKKIFIVIFLISLLSGSLLAQSGSYPGSFARLGFGARGLGMGNAMVSNIFGDVSGYYNPALACFQEEAVINLGYTFLNLDRRLNFVGVAKKFKFPNQSSGGAGISLGWLNAGVGNIDFRDNDAKPLELASTYENQFYLGTGFLLSDDIAFGVAFKLYNSKLYTDVTTSSIAFDIGVIYRENDNLVFGFSVKDLAAKFKWETSKIYGNLGTTTENKFPTLWNIGASYRLPNKRGSASLEFMYQHNPQAADNNSTSTAEIKNNYYIKAGAEYNLSTNPDMTILVRAGIDRIEPGSDDFTGNLKPGFGFSFGKLFSKSVILGLDYSFQFEPYSHYPMQNLGISFKFK